MAAALLALTCACAMSRARDGATPPTPACSLSAAELRERRSELLPGFIGRADEVTDLEDGLQLVFRSGRVQIAELAALIDAERTCCSFLRFQLTVEPGGGAIVLDVSGPSGTRELLRSL